MSAKSTRHKQNKKDESRLLDHDPIEQRALQIARDEGREEIAQDDRARAREELMAPNETQGEPEESPANEPKISEWDEPAGSSGKQAPKVKPEDDASIGKELAEEGMRGPKATRSAKGHGNA